MSAFTSDGYRVASEDELADYEAMLCQVCYGEPRQVAVFEDAAAFVDDATADQVCRPCAIFLWGCALLDGRTATAPDPDRTLRSKEMSLLIFASWMLRRPVVR